MDTQRKRAGHVDPTMENQTLSTNIDTTASLQLEEGYDGIIPCLPYGFTVMPRADVVVNSQLNANDYLRRTEEHSSRNWNGSGNLP